MAKFKNRGDASPPVSADTTAAGQDAASSDTARSGDTAAVELDRERVAERAYELYLSRGGGDGQDLDDWLVAEEELRGSGSSRDRES